LILTVIIDCTFCAVRAAAGTIASVPPEKVVRQFREGVEQGASRFALRAEDLGAYGQDIGSNIVELLSVLLEVDGEYQLSLVDFGPRWLVQFFPELLALFSRHRQKICHFQVPLQSGSDRILRLMKREHTVADAVNCVKAIRKELPELELGTHILVGFPTETEEDFLASVRLLREVSFSEVQVYPSSDRPGTPAASIVPKIPLGVTRLRIRRLHSLKRTFFRNRGCRFILNG